MTPYVIILNLTSSLNRSASYKCATERTVSRQISQFVRIRREDYDGLNMRLDKGRQRFHK